MIAPPPPPACAPCKPTRKRWCTAPGSNSARWRAPTGDSVNCSSPGRRRRRSIAATWRRWPRPTSSRCSGRRRAACGWHRQRCTARRTTACFPTPRSAPPSARSPDPTGRLARSTTAAPTGRVEAIASLSSGALRPMAERSAPDGAVLAAGMNQLVDSGGGAVVPASGGLVVAAEFLPRLNDLATVSTRPSRLPTVIAQPSGGVTFRRRFDDIGVVDGASARRLGARRAGRRCRSGGAAALPTGPPSGSPAPHLPGRRRTSFHRHSLSMTSPPARSLRRSRRPGDAARHGTRCRAGRDRPAT